MRAKPPDPKLQAKKAALNALKRARRAALATCEGSKDDGGTCGKPLVEGQSKKGWLWCKTYGKSFCCRPHAQIDNDSERMEALVPLF